MYNTGCIIFAHSILNPSHHSRSSTGASEDDGTMTISGRNVVGIHATTTPQSQSETSNAITTSSSSLFLLGLLWLMLWVVIIILILWSPIKIVSISRLSPWNAYIFPGSHPISAITNECPISPSNEVLCETIPWCHAAGDDQSRSRDDVLLDWSYFNRGVPFALFVSHSKMCLYGWMDWKRISPVDLNGCDQVY